MCCGAATQGDFSIVLLYRIQPYLVLHKHMSYVVLYEYGSCSYISFIEIKIKKTKYINWQSLKIFLV